MGLKESTKIHLRMIKELGDNPDGMCAPLAVMESCPDGYPPQSMHDEIISKITVLLRHQEHMTNDEFWNTIVAFFWPGKTADDLRFRSADDPEILAILNYVHEHRLPIVACITKPSHAIGLQFVKIKKVGVVAEFAYGPTGKRPYISLKDGKVRDESCFLKQNFFNAGGSFVVFPPIVE